MKSNKSLQSQARKSAILKFKFANDPAFKEKHQIAIKRVIAERVVSPEWENIKEKSRQGNIKFRKENPRTEEEKYACGNNMRGKTLEEILGEERAAAGKEARRQANFTQDYTGRGEKIAATRKANGSYENSGMTGHTHKESTKEKQGQKAKVRQDLKRSLGLGRNDSVPKDLLEAEYKRLGLK
jgi:hypothetical protein